MSLHSEVLEVREWSDVEVQVGCGEFICVERNAMSIIGALWVDDIGWDFGDRHVIEAFIKSGMGCHFDS